MTLTIFIILGEMNKNRQPNFLVVNTETPMSDIEGKQIINDPFEEKNSSIIDILLILLIIFNLFSDCLKAFIKRDDIDIILINQNVAEMVRHVIDGHTAPVPAILEIPSKDHPYDPSKDSILRRAKGLFNPDDMR